MESGGIAPKHVYDWLAEPAGNPGEKDAKEWLDKFTRPAYDKVRQGINRWLADRALTCMWRGERYRCTGASRLGDVWLRREGSAAYYDHRVDVQELSDWSMSLSTSPTAEPERVEADGEYDSEE